MMGIMGEYIYGEGTLKPGKLGKKRCYIVFGRKAHRGNHTVSDLGCGIGVGRLFDYGT